MPMAAPPRGRWIPPNESSRIPRTHIVLDCEALIHRDETGETHTFRIASTSCDKMSRKDDSWQKPEYGDHESAKDMWQWITERCKRKERTIVVAHNIGYDLRITDAFTILPMLGWELGHVSLQPGATWCSWRRESATMVCVDSMTWLPISIGAIGRLINMPKPTLPRQDESDEQWRERCRADVAILRCAWLRLVRWLRHSDLGNWRPTGAGMAWSAFRHRHITHRILIHEDAEQRDRERRAAWTGRAEPWRFGTQTDGPWVEWDFVCSYATIAAECEIPTRYIGPLRDATIASVRRAARTRAILAECVVRTSVPSVPTISDGRVVWPIGSFRTTLWDNEIALAEANGATVEIEAAWAYRKAPALKQWADWVLSLALADTGSVDSLVRVVAKHWSRALIGRFGSRFATWEEYGDARIAGARLSSYVDSDSGDLGQLLEVGGKAWKSGALTDHPQSAPQVMSWIMAEARCRLWNACLTAGTENVIYVDTDSIIVNGVGDARIANAGITGLRRKSRYNRLDILGTRRIIVDHDLRAAGVPKGSRKTSQRSWVGDAWSTLATDLNTGNVDSVRIVERTVTIRDHDSRRRRLPQGISAPYEMESV